MIQLNHITFSVSDITKSVKWYNIIFECAPIAFGEKMAYYDLDGIWFALNEEHVKRVKTYNHVAFSVDDFEALVHRLVEAQIEFEIGRSRHSEEKKSLYIRDEDLNLIEFHQGTLEERLRHYEKHRKDIKINRG